MPVTGLVIRDMEARRIKDISKELEIANDTKLTKVEEIDIPMFGKKGMNVWFKYSTVYQDRASKEKIAEINVGGTILYMSDKHEEMIRQWNETKKLPEDVNVEILNALLRRCITKAIVLSEDIQVPPPVMIPHAKRKGAPDNAYAP